ncbi:transcriptional regulator [Dokdonella sp.]|uniref:winged helix-turn-helix domain-containing protein n=1 Tax=Dokdonella sp. TaxID=2291710 RepID=UPI001B2BEAAA|nr:transcriptional regulator [Dokdonella sp.]MBO9662165.1 transcriptional regulator [Dokdonella sp.]
MTAPEHRFGEFRLAPGARELWRGGQLIALPPKSFDCLAYLIEHRERAVGRDELISAVWGRTDVSDDLLAQTLLRARRAVGDTGNEQRAIRTVPRFGYRWILPLEEIAGPAPAHPSDAAPPTPAAAAARARRGWSALLLPLALAVAALAVWQWREHAAPPPKSAAGGVLVLPVQREGGDNESAWLRLGAMDYIATQLRERARLQVLPSEQTLLLIGHDTDPTDAGALHRLELATGAGYVLAPSATFEHGEWKFLLDAYHDGGVRSFEASGANPLEAATIAVERFVADLGLGTREPAAGTMASEPLKRIDAAMLAGDLDAARRLVDALPAAARRDPETAVRIGQIAFRAGQLQAAGEAFAPLATAATTASVRAQALMGLGAVAVRQAHFDDAERHYSAAIAALAQSNEAPPDLVGSAYSGRGAAQAARNRFDAALADFGRARVELDRAGDRTGTATVDVNLGLLEGNRGHYADAVQAFDRAIAVFTRFGVRDHLAAALLGKTNAQLALLDGAGALAASARAEELAAQLENPLLKRRIAAARCAALIANGELDAAQAKLDAGGRDAADGAEFDLLRARLRLERGDVAGATQRAGAALTRAAERQEDLNAGDVVQLAVVATRRGAAPALLDQALARARQDEPNDPRVDVDLARRLGRAQQLALQDDPAAAQAYADAFAEADRHGAPEAFVAAAIAYADYLVRHRQAELAATVVGRLAPYAERDYGAARAVAALYRALGNSGFAGDAEARAKRLAGERDPRLPL